MVNFRWFGAPMTWETTRLRNHIKCWDVWSCSIMKRSVGQIQCLWGFIWTMGSGFFGCVSCPSCHILRRAWVSPEDLSPNMNKPDKPSVFDCLFAHIEQFISCDMWLASTAFTNFVKWQKNQGSWFWNWKRIENTAVVNLSQMRRVFTSCIQDLGV